MSRLTGVGVSSGRASGPVARVADPLPEPPATPAPTDPSAEAARIRPAADAVAEQLFQRAARVEGDAKAVLETTAAMAMDPALISQAEQQVTARSLPAARAVFEAANGFADALRAAGGYMAERARDVQDVRDRIIAELHGVTPPGVPELERPSVLLARDLAPADTADLDPALVLALVTEEGGPTSHTAILARALGIPAVVAVRGVLGSPDAIGAVVDGDSGAVELSDQDVPVRAAERASAAEWNGVGETADGEPVKVVANVGSNADASAAAAAGAQGVGLFRTEFCYLAADDEPGVETQRAAYHEVLAPFAGKPVVVRTLDAGADKPLAFLDMGDEPNPALGVRGLRVAFDRPEVLDRQLTAIAGAAADSGAEVSVMAPMVATAAEAAWFAERVRAAGLSRAGVMIEIPAAALSAREILAAVDFVSIGTNDLAQYVFAADRMAGALAELNDPWQPALLRLIEMIGRAGRELGKPVGVCGEAASDPLLAGVLAGLGATSLSMAAAAVPAVGAALAEHPMATFQKAAEAALAAADPAKAREAVKSILAH
ncbi:phosphotransferase system, enzyme I, PtsI [Saccharopolyspora antimicrobica]|uniref:Phosphoenolpyruvate-protein phosphotransferase n=1 Tax=Saccharopolyspora antimicrobica TaxID=455193 RepID=A0A1I4XCF2_9PSEU|nr:phosphoenolpyruvate--protein phosphotransferase [Saccharopolyspora antimicrobica]RKT84427.1 phosphoenolpyruvate--protein phosphotransferase [Saccharopolyspora antimicrobica]SFN23186.1 phosphotransferase system, enzyme I, PtsI [Saccharopolyspora antimicrobica]